MTNCNTQQNDTLHNIILTVVHFYYTECYAQHDGSVVMLRVNYAECCKLALYAECHYDECHGAFKTSRFSPMDKPGPSFSTIQWKRISRIQSARWQCLSRLKASAFFSLQKNVSCMNCNNLYSGLVTPSSGWWCPISCKHAKHSRWSIRNLLN